jgi:hypothetical protein
MEIFRIRLNSNEFQSFLPADTNIWQTDALKMDCKPKLSKWKAPEIYIQNPKREQGNFLHLCSGAFVTDSLAADRLRIILEIAGELLPFAHDGSPFFLLNVLECVNCLDDQSTEWVKGKTTGAKIRILKYHFDRGRLSESTLFKIPETAASEVLCVEGIKDPEDEFKAQVEASGFKGLMFEKLWSDQ